MTDKELRRMSRGDLIEIIYQYQQKEQELSEENSALRRALEDRKINIENAGSIAEAALAINHVFRDAQAAADQYLKSVQSVNAEKEIQAQLIIETANRQAALIIQKAEEKSEALRRDTEKACAAMREQATVKDAVNKIKDSFQK